MRPALALRMLSGDRQGWPDALLMLGDQIYADEVAIDTREFIKQRRDVTQPPGEEVADFEEFTHLYHDTWGEPVTRWLLSTVPSAMIFDDHDVSDDWNMSAAWVREARALPWWKERITGGFMSYWIYQHLGNLSPRELEDDPMFADVKQQGDAGALLREFAHRADREPGTCLWSVYRDFGRTRLIVMDSRAGRVLEEGRRRMIGTDEWAWIKERARGEFDHLLLGTSLPFILGHSGVSGDVLADAQLARQARTIRHALRLVVRLDAGVENPGAARWSEIAAPRLAAAACGTLV